MNNFFPTTATLLQNYKIKLYLPPPIDCITVLSRKINGTKNFSYTKILVEKFSNMTKLEN